MTVIKRGKSYWVDIGFNTKRHRKRSPENSYRGAQAYELLLRQRLARGEPLEQAKPEVQHTFKEVSLQWFEVYVKNNNKYSELLNKKYILHSDLIPYFGTKNINKINSYLIEQYKSHLINVKKLSPKSINNRLSALSRCLRSAEEWGLIEKIPKIKLQKVPPQKYDYLTDSESKLLLGSAYGIWQDMILLALQTGLRFGELIALRWQDIDFEKRLLTVNRNIVRGIECSPKGNKSRIIPITRGVLNMLNDKKKNCEFVFHDSNNYPLKYRACIRQLQKICAKAGLRKIGWHVLRHSFASQLASTNNSIVAIKELLGHSDIKTTMRYSHVNLPVLQKTIESLEQIICFNGTIATQLTIPEK
jgi:integrase